MTTDGELGFCGRAVPAVLPPGYHGPLVVALDSNVLIDVQQHGASMLDDTPWPPPVPADATYARDLDGLADLLELWLIRDIRLVVTPRSLTDAKKLSERFLSQRRASVDALAETLAFQLGDWSEGAPSHLPVPALRGAETGLPAGADRELVLEAQAIGAHVFLTRDEQVLHRTVLSGPPLRVVRPAQLRDLLTAVAPGLFSGGTCEQDGCPYGSWQLPAPDLGKWNGLLSIFESD